MTIFIENYTIHNMNQVRLHYNFEFFSTLLTQWVFTLTPIYFVLKGQLNPLQLILIGVVLESTVLLFEVPTGYLADRKSRVLSFTIGYGLMGLSFGVLVYQPNFMFSLIYSFLLGLGYTFVSGAQTAWILDETEESIHKSILIKASQYGSLGGIVGIGLAVIISLNTSIETSIFISGCGLILLCIFIILFAKEPNYTKQSEVHGTESGLIKQSINLIKSSSILKSLIVIALFYGFASEGFDRLWGLKVFGSNQLTEIESVWVIGALIIGVCANMFGVEWGLIITALLHCMIVYALIRFSRIRQTKSQIMKKYSKSRQSRKKHFLNKVYFFLRMKEKEEIDGKTNRKYRNNAKKMDD